MKPRASLFALLAGAFALAACGHVSRESKAPGADIPPAEKIALTPANPAAFFDCLRENKIAVIGAHRMGYRADRAENALSTGDAQLGETPALLEIDVRISKDGVLFALHDERLERTTTGSGDTREMAWAEIAPARLKAPNGAVSDETVPTLAKALEWAKGKAILQLDVKRAVPFDAVAKAVAAAGAENRVIVIVYNLQDAITVAKLNPRLMQSIGISKIEDVDMLAAGGVDTSRILAWTGAGAPNPALYQQLAARGIEVIFGTLGRPGESLDDRFAAEGDRGYWPLVQQGVQVIASNRGTAAAAALDAADGPGFAPGRCLTAR